MNTVEISLSEDVLAAFYRRGRRRLRDLQQSCEVSVQLEKSRSILRVTGTAAGIAAVHKQLGSLTGPLRDVSAATWAELMRTRTVRSGDHATVMRIQEQCGCRVHIERTRQEVRLFGAGEGIALADRLLEELASKVSEDFVPMANLEDLAAASLQALAMDMGVSLRVEAKRIAVLGFSQRVSAAIPEVRAYLADPQHSKYKLIADASNPQGADAEGDVQDRGLVFWDVPEPPGAAPAAQVKDVPEVPAGLPLTHISRRAAEPAPACRGGGMFRVCPTCGVGRFCSNCGAKVWKDDAAISLGGHPVHQCPQPQPTQTVATSHTSAEDQGQWMPNYCYMQQAQGGMMVMVPTGIPMGMMNNISNGCMVPAPDFGTFCAATGPAPCSAQTDGPEQGA